MDVQTRDYLFGAAVLALAESSPEHFAPIQLALSGLDTWDGFDHEGGGFRLEHLPREGSYRLIVVDGRDPNQMDNRGYDFNDEPGESGALSGQAGIEMAGVRRTDLWSEVNSGPAYSYEGMARFDTGFDFHLTEEFNAPDTGNYDADELCVEYFE